VSASNFVRRDSRPSPTPPAIRPQDAQDLQEFLDSLRARGRSPKTYATYRESVTMFATYTAQKGMPLLAAVRGGHVEDFLRLM
jgi:hypothetical protein